MTESAFFQDLAVLMTVAGIVAVVFSRFRWPKVLGYIGAGILLSEYTWGGSFLTDPNTFQIIGQLGVVFLMFGMGLTFSAREMRRIRFVAMPAAVLDTLVMIWLGYTIGTRVFHWTAVPSLFLGVAICDSATTLLAKVMDEMGWGTRPFVKYVLGTSLCEDIVCVGAVAVATGFAHGGTMSAGAFAASLGWLATFFLTVIVFGFILVPRLLLSVGKRKDDEVLLLSVLGSCFFVTYIAYRFDFSIALGAFLVGLLGASSAVRERISTLVDPLKFMFSAVFFVSIGLLVNPAALWANATAILLVSLVVVVGKFLNITLVSLLTGLDVKTSIQNGLSLAQIGEFAFLVSMMYAQIKGDSDMPMFQIAVGVSLLTTLANPFLVRASDRIGETVESRLSPRLRTLLTNYQAWLEKIRASEDMPAFMLLRASLIKLAIYGVLMFSVSVACLLLGRIDYTRFSVFFAAHAELIFFVVANLFALALTPLIVTAARAVGDEVAVLLVGYGNAKWQQAVKQIVNFVIFVAVVIGFFAEWTMLNITIAPTSDIVFWVVCALLVISGMVGWRFFLQAGHRATVRFHEALTAEERQEGFVKMTSVSLPEGSIRRIRLDAASPAIGETVGSLNIRAKTGAIVVSVVRKGVVTRNIGPEWEFAVGDTLVVLGESSQAAALKDLLGVVQQ